MGQGASTELREDGSSDLHKNDLWPMVHCPEYNLRFMGLEKMGKFDLLKGNNIRQILIAQKILTVNSFSTPVEITEAELKEVHTQEYMKSLKRSKTIAKITGISGLAIFPYSVIEKSIMRPLRVQASGSILAGKLAMEHGWAINLGGGQHHCSAGKSEPSGFSPYADVTLNIKYLCKNFPSVNRVLIIDLDVHQGNGYAHDFMNDETVYIFDMYNCMIFPGDETAKKAIKRKVELKNAMKDDEYINLLKSNIKEVLDEADPQYVLYNAGTDILKGDPLGKLNISPNGVKERDKIVFTEVRGRDIPIAMVLSGGFTRNTAGIVADSIT
uniref:histone deacetylase 11-like n=1 Tax=Styela clava TaxID=7725 RepID=UPI00193AAA4A|nr:histone deacetylase 11-like [Styela clava]